MGKVAKGIRCGAEMCKNVAVRSVPIEQAKEAGIKTSSAQRRVYLCDAHYKVLKKARRKEERLERWRWTR
ncbi:MAG: hypothetical protein ACUVTL_00995 [Thermoproteota archaeon]